MDTQYVKAKGMWTQDDRLLRNVEVQMLVEAEDGMDGTPAYLLTSLQVFGFNTGNPISGQVVFDPEQLRKLHEAIGKRVAELDETAERLRLLAEHSEPLEPKAEQS